MQRYICLWDFKIPKVTLLNILQCDFISRNRWYSLNMNYISQLSFFIFLSEAETSFHFWQTLIEANFSPTASLCHNGQKGFWKAFGEAFLKIAFFFFFQFPLVLLAAWKIPRMLSLRWKSKWVAKVNFYSCLSFPLIFVFILSQLIEMCE